MIIAATFLVLWALGCTATVLIPVPAAATGHFAGPHSAF